MKNRRLRHNENATTRRISNVQNRDPLERKRIKNETYK